MIVGFLFKKGIYFETSRETEIPHTSLVQFKNLRKIIIAQLFSI